MKNVNRKSVENREKSGEKRGKLKFFSSSGEESLFSALKTESRKEKNSYKIIRR